MKSRLIALTALLAACVALAACEKKQETAPTAATSSAAPTTAAPKVELADEDIAVPEDYLEEATKQVTPANYKAELDSIEKEIAATPQ